MVRNQDDHVKNIAFLMNQKGEWRLSPAFDVSYAHSPRGLWTSQHQITLNGKRDLFEKDDLFAFSQFCDLKKSSIKHIIQELHEKVASWRTYAKQAGVPGHMAGSIEKTMRSGMYV